MRQFLIWVTPEAQRNRHRLGSKGTVGEGGRDPQAQHTDTVSLGVTSKGQRWGGPSRREAGPGLGLVCWVGGRADPWP